MPEAARTAARRVSAAGNRPEPVRYERVGAAAVLTIDRQERRNAVDGPTADLLEEAFDAGKLRIDEPQFRGILALARTRDWVVYCKPPFAGPRCVLRYLANYTHRIAISDHRLVHFGQGKVTFRYRDAHDADASLVRPAIRCARNLIGDARWAGRGRFFRQDTRNPVGDR